MRALRREAVGICLTLITLGGSVVWAQGGAAIQKTPAWLPDYSWSGQMCRYPGPRSRAKNQTQRVARNTVLTEVEPNDQFANAQIISIAPGPMDPVNLDINATIGTGADVDLYRFTATKGDILGVAVLAGSGSLDPVLAIQQVNETSLIENDDHGYAGYYYPASSPFPVGVGLYDSALTWIAPGNGDYLIRVSSFTSSSRGDYKMEIRARRSSFENQDVGSTQIIFLDFDGATINAQETFSDSTARSQATLSPLRDFLPNWGLGLEDEPAVVQAIIDSVQRTVDNLRLASLNGDRDTDATPGHMDIQVLNSRDHADPWGQPNVSRAIIGGTEDQLGIYGIYGIAESIDPGNFDREETTVILLDYLSLPEADDYPGTPVSINSLRYASGLTMYDLIGETVGHIAVHEMGHYLGNWHTDSQNETVCIMDTGGNPIWYMTGAGPDGTLGTADDEVVEFVPDIFAPLEQIGSGEETTDLNSAFAFATGRVTRETLPPDDPAEPPLASVRATPNSGSPPLTVQFSAGAIDPSGADMIYTWDFADGTPTVVGSVVTHTFTIPGQFLVKLTATNSLGSSGEASTLVTVSAVLPTAKLTATPVRGSAPLTVDFDGRASTSPSGEIVKFEWDFGDNQTATGSTTEHKYVNSGYFACKLTVTDDNGGKSSATTLITVNPGTGSTNTETDSSTDGATPQCGLGSGVTMFASAAGLLGMGYMRRRR